jgi:hypothetical protein
MGDWDKASRTRWQVIPLPGGQQPDPENPSHFMRFKDRNGENARVTYSSSMKGQPVRAGQLVADGFLIGIEQPGTNYAVNDLLIVQGGTLAPGSPPAQIVVLGVTTIGGLIGPNGVIDIALLESGNYTTPPTNPVSVVNAPGGLGTGAKFNLTWRADTPNQHSVEKYGESDFLQLGITSDLSAPYG